MADISHIKGPDNTSYDIKDSDCRDIIALPYNSGNKYVVYDYCIYDGILRQCKADTPSPAGAFDSSKWKNIIVTDYLNTLRNGINTAMQNAVLKVGSDMSGTLNHTKTSGPCFKTNDRSVSWVQGASGNAALYCDKKYNENHWYPAVCLKTKGGSAWQIGNYDGDELRFVRVTKANIDSGTNETAVNIQIDANGKFTGTAQNAITWNGVTDDHNTNNTTDTWIPVYNGSKVQHRVISAQLNTYITGDGYSGCCSAKNCDTITYIKCIRIGQLVICNFALAFNSERTGEVAWVALNSNFRPARTLYFNVNIAGNSAANTNESAHRMYIYPDGTLKMWIDNTNAKVTQTFGEISFCTF